MKSYLIFLTKFVFVFIFSYVLFYITPAITYSLGVFNVIEIPNVLNTERYQNYMIVISFILSIISVIIYVVGIAEKEKENNNKK